MRVISKKKIRDYIIRNASSKVPLTLWYLNMKTVKADNLHQLQKAFNNKVDRVYGYTVFNIGGNNYRMICAIHYKTQRCYIRDIWTHAQYSKSENQLKLKRGLL